ncbi:MAG: hypothetical protein GXX99_08330 [Clostridiales bacterium]|nr:hypothetical protein [Clostridiales bacterium]
MRRRIFVVPLVLLLAALLLTTGCGGGREDEELVCKDYAEWTDALGYTPNTPAYIPMAEHSEVYVVEPGKVAKVIYEGEGQRIVYRMVQEADRELIRLDDYEVVGESTCKGFSVPLYGDAEGVHMAQWSEDGKTFALYFEQAVTVEQGDQQIMYS